MSYSPREKTPMKSWTRPDMKVRRMLRGILPCPNSAVIRDMMAVGPSVMSFDVPRKQYTKHPMKAEYRPY